jgi:hypothetical protein
VSRIEQVANITTAETLVFTQASPPVLCVGATTEYLVHAGYIAARTANKAIEAIGHAVHGYVPQADLPGQAGLVGQDLSVAALTQVATSSR